MKEISFYSIHEANVTAQDGTNEKMPGVIQHKGYGLTKQGVHLYVYQSYMGKLHYILPKAGIAVYSTFGQLEAAADIIPEDVIKNVKEYQRKPEYRGMQKIFDMYVTAAQSLKDYRNLFGTKRGDNNEEN